MPIDRAPGKHPATALPAGVASLVFGHLLEPQAGVCPNPSTQMSACDGPRPAVRQNQIAPRPLPPPSRASTARVCSGLVAVASDDMAIKQVCLEPKSPALHPFRRGLNGATPAVCGRLAMRPEAPSLSPKCADEPGGSYHVRCVGGIAGDLREICKGICLALANILARPIAQSPACSQNSIAHPMLASTP